MRKKPKKRKGRIGGIAEKFGKSSAYIDSLKILNHERQYPGYIEALYQCFQP